MAGSFLPIRPLRSVSLAALCLLAAVLLCGAPSDSAAAARHLLLGPVESLPPFLPGKHEGIGTSEGPGRPVRMNDAFRRVGAIAEGDRIVVDLFVGAPVEAVVDRIFVNVRGSRTVRARVEGRPFSYVLIVTTENRSVASVVMPEQNRRYRIVCGETSEGCRLADIGEERRHHLPPQALPIPRKREATPDGACLRSPASAPLGGSIVSGELLRSDNGDPGVDDPATIDVMVVYTPAARGWADDEEGGMDNIIATAMATAQLAADNSRTGVTFRLVHSAEVAYSESGSSRKDLDRLTDGSGPFQNVHAWRDRHGADLVALFTATEEVGGLAWLLDDPGGEPDYAFSLTRVQQAATSYALAHELGHTMGLGHHRNQSFQPGPGLFDYSAGWRWTGMDGRHYCSIMTYGGGGYFNDGITHEQVPHFSNPAVLYAGVATGHETQGDNARTMRETKQVVAAYRIRELLRGDLNNDRVVNLADLVIALQVFAGRDSGVINAEAVVSDDGTVSLADALYILRHLAAW